MIPGEFLDLTIRLGDNNTSTFKIYREEREKLDILPPIQYDNKMFENRMLFDCEGRESIVLFTNSVLCNPSFRNCERATLIVYESYIHADSFGASILNNKLPEFYNLLFSNSHFTFDETKEFMKGDKGSSVRQSGFFKNNRESFKQGKDRELEYFYPFIQDSQTLKCHKIDDFRVFGMKEVDWKEMDDEKPQDPEKAIPLGPDEEYCGEPYGKGCKRNKKTKVYTILEPADGAWYDDTLEFSKEE